VNQTRCYGPMPRWHDTKPCETEPSRREISNQPGKDTGMRETVTGFASRQFTRSVPTTAAANVTA
jgi:hypothetical protein